MNRFTFKESDMTCPTCGKGPDECDAAYYADAECAEAEVEQEEEEFIKEEMRGAA